MKKIYLGVSLLLGMLGMSSCDDFLEAYSQSMTVAKTVDNLDEVLIGSICTRGMWLGNISPNLDAISLNFRHLNQIF